jgi:hypothetical protein
MATDGIPPKAHALIISAINSLSQLEILLWFLDRAPRPADAPSAAAELRLGTDATQQQVAELAQCGLLAPAPGGYRYAPATAELHDAVNELARTYSERRVAVISLIYSKPPEHLRNIAEAFRFGRKSNKDPGHG